MESEVPPIVLHIGRGKSGSSTIQSLASAHADFMRAQGVSCPLTINGISNHARLSSALYDPESDPSTLRKFRRDARKHQKSKVFISAEALFSLGRPQIQHLKRLIGNRETRILAYVREYPGWLQSVYAQRTKKASNALDFDEYYKLTRPTMTILPRLERWADAFGWEKIRVRPLEPAALVGGDLITDVLHALDVKDSPGDVASLNITPHWITLELQRALVLAAAEAPAVTIDPKSARRTRAFIESCVSDVKPHRVQYFTKEQWRDLAELYRADMESLSKRMGTPLPVSLREPEERPFLPAFSAIPENVKTNIKEKLRERGHQLRVEPGVRQTLKRLLDY